jgi:hypothetical protein
MVILGQTLNVRGQILDAISLLRRGVARAGEIGAIGGFFDYIGIIPQFSDIISTFNGFVGSVLMTLALSGIYDCIELAIRPDMRLPPCKNSEPELPLERK